MRAHGLLFSRHDLFLIYRRGLDARSEEHTSELQSLQQTLFPYTTLFRSLDLKDVLPFEQGLLDYIDHNTDILKTIRETEEFTTDTEAALDKAVDEFRSTFVSSAGKPLVEKKPDVDKAATVDQEKIVAGEK